MFEFMQSRRSVGMYFLPSLFAMALLSLCQGGEPASARPAPKSTNAKMAATAKLYDQRCERCHGADGKGSESSMPDFTSRAWQKRRTDVQFFVSILDGKKTMPGFRKKLMLRLVVTARGCGPIAEKTATYIAKSASSIMVGPEIVPPGRSWLSSNRRRTRTSP